MQVSGNEHGVLEIRGDLHISDAEVLRNALLGELTTSFPVAIDLSAVDSCDTASLQLLCSLVKSAERDGRNLIISTPSSAVREASATLGLRLADMKSTSTN